MLASEKLEQAHRISPNECNILYHLAWLFAQKNDATTSVHWLRLLIRNDPNENRSTLEMQPDFERIREHPLFIEFLKELNAD